MIIKVRLSKLRVSESVQFLTDVLTLCKQQSTEPMKLTAVIAVLATDTAEFDKCFKLAKASLITEELVAIDDRRDKCVVGIHLVLSGYSYHFQADIQKAAQELILSMDKYGKRIASLNYPSQTSTVNSILADWKNVSKFAAAVTLLDLSDWAAELNTSNTLFNDRYLLRVEEKASATQVKTFEARKKAVESYNELLKQIEAHATLAEDNSFDALINNLNALIARYNVIADSHTTPPKKDKTPKTIS